MSHDKWSSMHVGIRHKQSVYYLLLDDWQKWSEGFKYFHVQLVLKRKKLP